MLASLYIKNFTIIENLEILFKEGMTTITGETGAGKSILLLALNITLGSRVDKSSLHECKSTEISAIFNITNNFLATKWLNEKNLKENDELNCIIRRTITPNGKSKAYINGSPVTLSEIKTLAPLLLNLYTQHAHYSLLEENKQLERLDTYANHKKLLLNVKASYSNYIVIDKKLSYKKDKNKTLKTQKELLEYQLQELNDLELDSNDIKKLESELKLLENTSQQIEVLKNCSYQLSESEYNLNSKLSSIIATLENIPVMTSEIKNSIDTLNEAQINIQETQHEITKAIDNTTADPEKLHTLNNFIGKCYEISRKHHIQIHDLNKFKDNLSQQLFLMTNLDKEISLLEQQLKNAKIQYQTDAEKLSQSRKHSSIEFSKKIKQQLHKLNIKNAKFNVSLEKYSYMNSLGIDSCSFEISFNIGQTLQPLSKVISGGELSRVGLAIQVISSEKIAPPTIIFDEVDVGISGATSEEVGKLLQKLSKKAQVICITHQAQVAVQGNQHLHVNKKFQKSNTLFNVIELSKKQRITEIARIIGGVNITPQTLAHAEQMLANNVSM